MTGAVTTGADANGGADAGARVVALGAAVGVSTVNAVEEGARVEAIQIAATSAVASGAAASGVALVIKARVRAERSRVTGSVPRANGADPPSNPLCVPGSREASAGER